MSMMKPHHDHTFGQDLKRPGESRTVVVIVLTAADRKFKESGVGDGNIEMFRRIVRGF